MRLHGTNGRTGDGRSLVPILPSMRGRDDSGGPRMPRYTHGVLGRLHRVLCSQRTQMGGEEVPSSLSELHGNAADKKLSRPGATMR